MIPRSCFGRILNMKQRGNRGEEVWKQFTIDNYSQDKCAMDDGTPSHYITCKSITEPGIVVNLHPEFIAKIFAGIEPTVKVEGISIIDQLPTEIVATREVVPEVKAPKSLTTSSKVSKKERAQEIYGRLVDAGSSRTLVIQAFMDELSMTKAGASTYYYNCAKDRI